MSYRVLKLLTILIPTFIIGGFEFVRHEFLTHLFSMEAGNVIITLLTLMFSYLFSLWMFRTIEQKNRQLADEKARSAVYEERERLARELHDNIAQIVFFMNVKMKQGKMEEASAALSDIDHHLRQAIFNLRSSPEESLSFEDRIAKWLNEWSATAGIDVSTEIRLPPRCFSTSEEVQLFAIVQEAFMNIRKHSQANNAAIRFRADSESWSMEIEDDGIGITNISNENKYGLLMMKKRASDLHAAFDMMNRNGGGTMLRLESRR
ncbi:sensor histidine kinase [Paenibacillus thermotolerans]|uniref:sensor histidine kinase n=1 Tax=Paenibacillus thermotolerans TaxID=3027807 RepID=UPI0023685AE6|nr:MULTISPECIES: histidine kinase [unclassified Paenibacillus]